ncbi:TPA: hypothetical protein I8374_001625 [Serratia marcescens]|uniref:hypothetical protein n=1 Tax=Serratia TaxID=613 RepID=UPI0018D8C759|nr:hypothetical protein [Serratia marcescens]MBH3204934.1 hypothetical protein [Serratia marcescens]MDX7538549.1 hypothetical protein [Serratia marcescens]HAT2867203.1 hypothetical protein [Serratia marcescens]HAT2872434.1 hypothetical protein [Serratia marcescens]HAT2923088.1 hypothetical protein [Serratia marcescens]
MPNTGGNTTVTPIPEGPNKDDLAYISDEIRKGDQFYLDASHKNHLEVFDSKGNFRVFLNLDGSVNVDKTKIAVTEGRKLPND